MDAIQLLQSPFFWIVLVVLLLALSTSVKQFGGSENSENSNSDTSENSNSENTDTPYQKWHKTYVLGHSRDNMINGAMAVQPHVFKAYSAAAPHLKQAYMEALPHIMSAAQTSGPFVAMELRQASQALSELSDIIDNQSK